MLISFRQIFIQTCFSALHANKITIHADFNSLKRKSIILSEIEALSFYWLEGKLECKLTNKAIPM